MPVPVHSRAEADNGAVELCVIHRRQVPTGSE